jgi:catechol 2,3-dioxygenase-like lactoylglutathione lyase family enzyme
MMNMPDTNPSMLSHISLGTNRFEEARAFYEQLLATLDRQVLMEHPGATAFGKAYPEFWLQTPVDGKPATTGNGVHVGFYAASKAEVEAFHCKALQLGAIDDGAPGGREHYGTPYCGCFVRDLDGNKIEATYWDMDLAKTLGMA